MPLVSRFTLQVVSTFGLVCSLGYLHAQDRKALEDQYKNKFVVVLKNGLAVGLCSERRLDWTTPPSPVLTVTINGGSAEYHEQRGSSVSMSGCTVVTPEPIHKGEVLRVENIKIQKVLMQGRQCGLKVINVSPHAVERGIGAFAHQSDERGEAFIVFKLDETDDVSQASSLLGEWFKVFDTQDAAATFGNTTSGVYVKQIKAGMTIAEVESVLGIPETRVDLTDRILYKYRDMTIEFRHGTVSDVR